MNRWLRRILVLVVITIVIITLRLTVFRPEPVPVSVHVVGRGRVESTLVNSRAGTVKSRHRARMSPGIAGLVARIPASEGNRVEAGEVLLLLEDAEFQAQVQLAERTLEASVETANEARLGSEQAERDRRRAVDLFANTLVSEQRVEETINAAERAVARWQASKQVVKQAEASLALAEANLAKSVMVAPFAGVVLDITTEIGEWITPAPPGVFIPPVIDLIDPDTLYVEAPLDEADVSQVAVGQMVRITLDAFRGQEFSGQLTYASSFVETAIEQNRTLTVEAEFSKGKLPANLLPGLSVDVEVILAFHDDVLRIPTYTLLAGNRVLVVRKGLLVERKVKTGLSNWQYTEIISGLESGDRLVVSLDRVDVVAGAEVTVTKEEAR